MKALQRSLRTRQDDSPKETNKQAGTSGSLVHSFIHSFLTQLEAYRNPFPLGRYTIKVNIQRPGDSRGEKTKEVKGVLM